MKKKSEEKVKMGKKQQFKPREQRGEQKKEQKRGEWNGSWGMGGSTVRQKAAKYSIDFVFMAASLVEQFRRPFTAASQNVTAPP